MSSQVILLKFVGEFFINPNVCRNFCMCVCIYMLYCTGQNRELVPDWDCKLLLSFFLSFFFFFFSSSSSSSFFFPFFTFFLIIIIIIIFKCNLDVYYFQHSACLASHFHIASWWAGSGSFLAQMKVVLSWGCRTHIDMMPWCRKHFWTCYFVITSTTTYMIRQRS
jgi:hypothetical protein